MTHPAPPTTIPAVQRSPTPLFVAALALAGIVVSLQQTLIIPLIPQLPRLLDTSATNATWVVTVTVLAGAVATPTVGRLADMFGKRRMLVICLLVLTTGSVIAAFGTTLIPLIVGRALQGLAAGVVPLGISLMRDHLPAERIGSATALMSASLGVGGALGLPLAALIAEHADWHALFWGAGGLAAVSTVLVLLLVPESEQRSGGRFDLLGAVLLSIALICLLLAVSKGSGWGWSSPATLGLLIGFAAALLAWGSWELRTREPLVDLRVSRNRQVLLTNAASTLFGFSMFAMSLVFPQLLQLPALTGYGLGQSMLVAGLVLLPGGLCMIATSPVSARITAASGPRTTLMLGAAVVAAGYGFGTVLHATVWQLLISSMIVSTGVGLAYGAMPTLVMAAVPVSQTAAANSLNNLMRAIGISVASAVCGILLAQLTTTTGGLTVPSEGAFELLLAISAVTSLLSLAIAAAIPPRTSGAAGPDASSGREPISGESAANPASGRP